MTRVAQQESRGPVPSVCFASDLLVNPGESFLCKEAEICRKQGFSANECCRAQRPRRLRLKKSHQQRERRRADQVQGVAGAHWGVDCERARRSFFDLDEV